MQGSSRCDGPSARQEGGNELELVPFGHLERATALLLLVVPSRVMNDNGANDDMALTDDWCLVWGGYDDIMFIEYNVVSIITKRTNR